MPTDRISLVPLPLARSGRKEYTLTINHKLSVVSQLTQGYYHLCQESRKTVSDQVIAEYDTIGIVLEHLLAEKRAHHATADARATYLMRVMSWSWQRREILDPTQASPEFACQDDETEEMRLREMGAGARAAFDAMHPVELGARAKAAFDTLRVLYGEIPEAGSPLNKSW